jgi:hypothetical protein
VEIFNMQLSPAAQHKTLFDGNYRLRLKRKPSVQVIIACGSKNSPSIKKMTFCPFHASKIAYRHLHPSKLMESRKKCQNEKCPRVSRTVRKCSTGRKPLSR